MDGLEVETNRKLGRIVAVEGSHAIVLLEDRQEPAPGHTRRSGQLGTLVAMPTSISVVFGIISALDIPLPALEPDQDELELAEIELVGEIVDRAGDRRHFRQGISIFPALGESVFVATPDDLRLVYAAPSAVAARVGTVHQDRSLPAFILTDELLGKHFAVLGSTGTGKSCAVALILRTILAHNQKGHVLLLDVHNEYAPAFRDMAEIFDASSFELPYWLLTFDELEEILLSGVSDRAVVGAILSDLILNAKRLFAEHSGRAQTVALDTPVPYRLSDIDRLLDTAAGSLNKAADSSPYMTLKTRLAATRSDPRFGFIFPKLVVTDNMEAVLSRLFRVPTNGKPISIVDLSAVPSEILGVVVGVLSRISFQFALWSDQSVPILLVCEEAHRYCAQEAGPNFELARRALARIAKEGRKHGVSLCLVSQRPSEISADVLSQCNTIFALRINNTQDQTSLRGTLRESSLGLLEFLPALRNAEAIAIGEGVPVPVRLCFDVLPEYARPLSGTARFSVAWVKEVEDPAFLGTLIKRWRQEGS